MSDCVVEAVAEGLELRPELAVVVDLAVEDDRQVARTAGHRLVAGREVDDRQPTESQGDRVGDEVAVVVGTAVPDLVGHGADDRRHCPETDRSPRSRTARTSGGIVGEGSGAPALTACRDGPVIGDARPSRRGIGTSTERASGRGVPNPPGQRMCAGLERRHRRRELGAQARVVPGPVAKRSSRRGWHTRPKAADRPSIAVAVKVGVDPVLNFAPTPLTGSRSSVPTCRGGRYRRGRSSRSSSGRRCSTSRPRSRTGCSSSTG